MRKGPVLTAVIALCFLGRTLFAQCSDADRKTLEAFDRAWGDAALKGDRGALTTIFADDYMDVSPAGPINKAQTIDNAVRQAEADRANPAAVATVDHDYYIIECTPNSALITHRNVIHRPNGTTLYTRSVHSLEKRGGKWVVVGNAGHLLDDAGILLYMEREWAGADLRKDASWYERNLADDFGGIRSRDGAPLSRHQAIEEARRGGLDLEDLSDMNVKIEGNTAVVTGVTHVKGKDDKGMAFDRNVRFTDVFVKRDGRWQVLSTQGTVIQK